MVLQGVLVSGWACLGLWRPRLIQPCELHTASAEQMLVSSTLQQSRLGEQTATLDKEFGDGYLQTWHTCPAAPLSLAERFLQGVLLRGLPNNKIHKCKSMQARTAVLQAERRFMWALATQITQFLCILGLRSRSQMTTCYGLLNC